MSPSRPTTTWSGIHVGPKEGKAQTADTEICVATLGGRRVIFAFGR